MSCLRGEVGRGVAGGGDPYRRRDYPPHGNHLTQDCGRITFITKHFERNMGNDVLIIGSLDV